MYVVFDYERRSATGRAARRPEPDESPASAAISRENAQPSRPGLSQAQPNQPSVSLCGVSHVTVLSRMVIALCRCVGPGRPRGAAWRDGRGDEPCCFSRYVRIVARTAFAIVNNFYCIPAYVVWMMALRLLRPFYAPVYWKTEGLMYHWLLSMVSLWSWTAGYQILESGDDPAACGSHRTLVLSNHQSTADVPILMAAWNPRPGLLSNLMWIMDRVFKFTNFGIVSVLHEDFFIQAGRTKRESSLKELRNHIINSYIPRERQFMVLFPEGGFLHKRREVSQRFAEKNNLPKLEYVSLPRAGAMKVIMDEIGPNKESGASTSKDQTKNDDNCNQNNSKIHHKNNDHLEWVLDVTIAYPDRIPLHLQDIVCGIRPPCNVRLHYRLYPITEVPSDDEGMTQWLYDRFIEKDKMLEEYYRTGQFPSKGDNTTVRPVRQDNLRYFIIHSFFIASTYVQYVMFQSLWSWIW